ncbi:MAG: peroxiredoxin [Methylococcaceae bacterium]|nr:peroxiredoxin [Methylococcaceae bacterium]
MSKLLEKNQEAPFFRAVNQHNQLLYLSDYKGEKNVVLYFYPKDDTPGCTIEANDFTALAKEFAAENTVIIGVSKDDCASHRAFIDKYGLDVQLLADTSGELCESYGVWQEVEKDGVKKWKIVRSTFIINKQGILEEAQYGVNPEGHAQAVLELVKALNA